MRLRENQCRWAMVDRTERVDLNQLFDQMSAADVEVHAARGILPEWFESTVGATWAQGPIGSE